ncbi:DUF3445 domain-containing protein [Pseudohoeflea suaedae]|uniref:DUF3445 domain-containing protein n=1 Tax=Pseudohoeflea suaedae TaxID=877384 RepID=A0A4R5PJL8_9HYPH|nr:DUF3445 domain-containing protein [Pseudohoeflea suaedae]TDH35860.1 DUF3445 domain-containing protein [Pseudohoeflea suaedae]
MGEAWPATPFAIGLSPLGERPWLIASDRLPDYLAEKHRLHAERPDRVFVAEPGTRAAQEETLQRVANWQTAHSPDRFSREEGSIRIEGMETPVELEGSDAPLLTAAWLCAEDLVLMRRGEDGWRLAAASLSFPSSWRLAEKFRRPITAIHKPVPGFSHGTRKALLVERIFDNLKPEAPVLRGNWSIYGDDKLFHPEPHAGDGADSAQPAASFLREERQTLTLLPGSGDILFTILITVTPLSELEKSADGRARASILAEQLDAMRDDELAYKAMTGRRDTFVKLLGKIATGTN